MHRDAAGASEATVAAAARGDADGDDEELEPSIRQHRAELEALVQQDPEFYAYLKETDEDLLAFGVGEGDESEEDASGSSQDAAEQQVQLLMLRMLVAFHHA